MFAGEAPGENEELYGMPFTGPAGKLLNKLLAEMDLSMENNTYVCNVLKYRVCVSFLIGTPIYLLTQPPENRDPNTKEVQLHTPYLLRQLDIIQPKLIVPLGNWAAKYHSILQVRAISQ